MNKWLQNFAYRIGLGWWVFALAGSIALFIALLTVSFQSYRAAGKNPVDALRYE
jgi:putative ABC transport system permease protein